MSLLKTLPLRGLARAGSTRASLRSSSLRNAGRRGYASAKAAGEEAKQQIGSDMPWLVGSVVAAVVPTYFILANGKLDNPLSYPRPGSHHHGEEHGDDEHEDAEEPEEKDEGEDKAEAKEDGGDEEKSDEKEDAGDDKKEDKEDAGDDEKTEASEKKGKADTGKKDAALSTTATDEQVANGGGDQEYEIEDGSASRKIHKPDAKGGAKRRIESPNSIKQGAAESDAGDVRLANSAVAPSATATATAFAA
ncbi:hypothetical protein FH972_024489 [Carpinus fangiana]|uniref:Uncharacterized protein n=1 Tax=Carpinus fangiana TaxID=176857 RepID=A0A5N6KY60_9ROSI|nr:hypothetical protein FH972_024489 [Carpinus fangiana]